MAKAKENKPIRLEWIDTEDLAVNPHNWRLHPDEQKQSIDEAISQVGWAGALLYNERTKRLIDGHARKELFKGKGKVPVLVGSWSEEQEKIILATLDPIASMARTEQGKLANLIKDLPDQMQATREMLNQLIAASPGVDLTSQIVSDYQDKEIIPRIVNPPEEFASYDESIETEHQCPKCGYKWSGKSSSDSD